jgi:hypothetical protein
MLTRIGKLIVLPGIFAVIYLGWVFGNRWLENRRYQREAAAPEQVPEQYRGNALKISQFYSPRAGLVCYGVVNAKHVKITPEPGDVAPSVSRCIEVHESKDTTFTLTAEAEAGTSTSQTVLVKAH